MALNDLMISAGASIFYDAGFRAVLEDHMNYLRADPNTTTLAVQPGEAYRFEYDLYGLLSKYGVPAHLHWVTMRMNNYLSPEEFTGAKDTLLVPDPTVVSRLQQSHEMTRRVT